MRTLTPYEHTDRTGLLGRLGMEFVHLPYGQLRRLHEHNYGHLKGWVKGKTFKNGYPTSWSSVKWRPLAGYARHRWKGLLGLAGRWATASVKELQWGWTCTEPRRFIAELDEFNDGEEPERETTDRKREGEENENENEEVEITVLDLEGFFPNI